MAYEQQAGASHCVASTGCSGDLSDVVQHQRNGDGLRGGEQEQRAETPVDDPQHLP